MITLNQFRENIADQLVRAFIYSKLEDIFNWLKEHCFVGGDHRIFHLDIGVDILPGHEQNDLYLCSENLKEAMNQAFNQYHPSYDADDIESDDDAISHDGKDVDEEAIMVSPQNIKFDFWKIQF